MPSTMISRPGSLRPWAKVSGDSAGLTDSTDAGAKGAFGAGNRCFERPFVQERRSQTNMAVAAFNRNVSWVDLTVPHQGVCQTNRRRDLVDERQLGRPDQGGIALDSRLAFADGIQRGRNERQYTVRETIEIGIADD